MRAKKKLSAITRAIEREAEIKMRESPGKTMYEINLPDDLIRGLIDGKILHISHPKGIASFTLEDLYPNRIKCYFHPESEEARRIATRNGLDFGNRIDMKGELMGAKYFEEELDTEGRDVYRHPKEN